MIIKKITTMKISIETLNRLKKLGNMGQSYEDVIIKLLNKIEK